MTTDRPREPSGSPAPRNGEDPEPSPPPSATGAEQAAAGSAVSTPEPGPDRSTAVGAAGAPQRGETRPAGPAVASGRAGARELPTSEAPTTRPTGSTPLVSVVVPTYDHGEQVGGAVDSVLAQTVSDLELVVVDDGSTDGTADRLGEYTDERIEVVRHPENRGVSAARNTGLEAATGEYVAFLDADDRWAPAKLERQVERLRAGPDDAVAAYCNVRRRRDDAVKQAAEHLFAERVGHEGREDLLPAVFAMEVAVHFGSTGIVRRAATADLRFDEGLAVLEDLDYLVRVLGRGRLVHLDEALVTLTETGYAPARAERVARERYLAKHAAQIEEFEARGRSIRAVHDFFLAKACFRDGQFARGSRRLARSTVPDGRQLAGLVWSAFAGATAVPR